MSAVHLQTVLSSSSLTDKADELQHFVTGFDSEAGPMNLNLISATCEFCPALIILVFINLPLYCLFTDTVQILFSLIICRFAGLADVLWYVTLVSKVPNHCRFLNIGSLEPLTMFLDLSYCYGWTMVIT